MTGRRLGIVLLCLSVIALVLTHTLPWCRPVCKTVAVIFACAVVTVHISMPLVIALARRLGAIDKPDPRKIHTIPTPRMGGLAVYAAVMLSLLITSTQYMPDLKALIIGSTLVMLVGLIDDARGVSAALRLLAQLAACVVLIMGDVHVTFLPDTWWGVGGEWIITTIWLIGITNAVNFLDGMDGLLSGLAASTSLVYLGLALMRQDSYMLAYCSVAILGASLCFMSYNMKPARVFLGDGGSNFIGFVLAALSIQGTWAERDPLASFLIPVLVLSVPIYDMVFTTVSRIVSGKVRTVRQWIEYTGRDHIHHRFEALGMSRTQVVATIWFLNMAIGLAAIPLYRGTTYGAVALVLQSICIYTVIAILEVLGERRPAAR